MIEILLKIPNSGFLRICFANLQDSFFAQIVYVSDFFSHKIVSEIYLFILLEPLWLRTVNISTDTISCIGTSAEL